MKPIEDVPQSSSTNELKPNELMTLHKTFSADEGKREVIFYATTDGKTVTKLKGASLLEFIENFHGGIVRMTAVASLDAYVRSLSDKGGVIRFAHWHTTGIDKGLSPEKIVLAYHAAPDSIFRTFTYDADLAELRRVVDERNAIDQFYNDALRKLRQAGRNCGVAEVDEDEDFQHSLDALDDVAKMFKVAGVNDKLVSYDTRIKQLASKNPLCVLFNQIAGIGDSWVSAATIVSLAQGIDRFPRVSDFLSYFGMGDAKEQKRKKGQPSNWSAAGRCMCFKLGESLIKNKKNPWRQTFDDAKDLYLLRHEDSCGCKAKKGHPHAQARRKMVKEILKQFYLAATDQQFVAGYKTDQPSSGNHVDGVGLGAAAGK